jgi:hypothetical protein
MNIPDDYYLMFLPNISGEIGIIYENSYCTYDAKLPDIFYNKLCISGHN